MFGAVNALLVLRVKVPPFITTLGMTFVATGLVTVVTAGNPIFGFPAGFDDVAQLDLFGIPFLVYYAVVIGIGF